MAAELEQRLTEFLDMLLREGNFQLSYQFVQRPDALAGLPGLIVDFSGADANLLLAEDGELLRSFEHLAFEALKLTSHEHDQVTFDCHHRRLLRMQELHEAACLAGERVKQSGLPYAFRPMNPRDRRLVHLALQGVEGVVSESEGTGFDRHVVVKRA